MNHIDPTLSNSADLERLARRRAGAKMGWYIHASVYVLVNLAMFALSAARGHQWAVYPLAGWGLGLLIHGAVIWCVMSAGGLHKRLVERERRMLGGKDRQ